MTNQPDFKAIQNQRIKRIVEQGEFICSKIHQNRGNVAFYSLGQAHEIAQAIGDLECDLDCLSDRVTSIQICLERIEKKLKFLLEE